MRGEARVKLFCMGQAQEKLLRTSDAAALPINRVEPSKLFISNSFRGD